MTDVTPIASNRVVCIRSADRAFGIPSDFGISLSQYNLNPKYVCWHQINIPNGFYNVNSLDNSITYTVINASDVPFVITTTIPAGNYSTTTLLNTLNTYMNADATTYASAPANFFSFTVSNLTGYFTLSRATASWKFSIDTSVEALEWILGYRSTQTISAVTTATGAAILDLRAVPVIFIRSSMVSGNYLSVRGIDSVLAVVQNTALFTQTIFQRLPSADIDLFPVSGHLSQVNFQLVDEWGRELNMDTNQEWEISVSLYT